MEQTERNERDIKILAEAIIEQQTSGQVCPQNMKELKAIIEAFKMG